MNFTNSSLTSQVYSSRKFHCKCCIYEKWEKIFVVWNVCQSLSQCNMKIYPEFMSEWKNWINWHKSDDSEIFLAILYTMDFHKWSAIIHACDCVLCCLWVSCIHACVYVFIFIYRSMMHYRHQTQQEITFHSHLEHHGIMFVYTIFIWLNVTACICNWHHPNLFI